MAPKPIQAVDRPVALSIAGSDSGGGAGVQMDLRTMHRLGVFGTTAISAITAQNLGGVTEVAGTAPALLAAQIDAVVTGFRPAAIKAGMLWSAALIEVVVDRLPSGRVPLVVDPVMIATSGTRLLDDTAVDAYAALLKQATVVTPNLDEAPVLLGSSMDFGRLDDCAQRLFEHLGCAVLLKGGHCDGDPIDTLVTADGVMQWRHARVQGVNTHGSGCMLSAAIAARLAHSDSLSAACEAALALTHDALAKGTARAPASLAAVEHAVIDPTHLHRIR